MDNKLHKVVPEKMPSFSEEKRVKIYPTFSIDDEDLPALKDFKVGEKKVLEIEVEQMSMRQGAEWQGSTSGDKKIHATFKILKVGVKKENYSQEYSRKRSGALS